MGRPKDKEYSGCHTLILVSLRLNGISGSDFDVVGRLRLLNGYLVLA